jgi:hypothetical protein
MDEFNILNPQKIIEFFVLYSPIILALGCLNLSFVFQNFKGFIYIITLLITCIMREYILMIYYGFQPSPNPTQVLNTSCSKVKYSGYENVGFSTFVISYTLVYMCFPMFLNKEVNYPIFGGLITYLCIDMGYRYSIGCVKSSVLIFSNFIFGMIASMIILAVIYASNLQGQLFFNETSRNKNVCSMAKKQTFKCSVYKNGELVGNTNA